MFQTVDLYIGIFLVLSGFAIALLNLRSVLKGNGKFSHVLLSENIILMCIGLAFLSRAVFSLHPANFNIEEFEERMLKSSTHFESLPCGFASLLISYGPLIVSMVNSFLSLVIDNYMHYQMLREEKIKEDENVVQNLSENVQTERSITLNKFVIFLKGHSTYITIILQWIVPIMMALFLYPMNVQEVSMNEMRNLHDNCISILDLTNKKCAPNYTMPLHKYISIPNLTETYEFEYKMNKTEEIDLVLKNVLKILNNYTNNTDFSYVQSKSARTPKSDDCMKICVTDNKNILLYMVILAFISFFVPITISTAILTKIHTMKVKKGNVKTYITKDVLYNILFWSPVMFDTFLSLILCSFSMHSTRASLFNAIANIYQAVKNFMNIKHFKDNMIVPI